MAVSENIAWLVISAWYYYNLTYDDIKLLFRVSESTTRRIVKQWLSTGSPVKGTKQRKRRDDLLRTKELISQVETMYKENPAIYLDELQRQVQRANGGKTISYTTILRILQFDLKYTRRIMEKAARYASFGAQLDFFTCLSWVYSNMNQLVFVDEASRDARSTFRKRGYGPRGGKLIARSPFERGSRISVLAASDLSGFFAWAQTMGTYDSKTFYDHFKQQILPLLNPWPLPRSIVILDNAAIHRADIVELIESAGTRVFFLPPYSPYLNPIETAFGRFKSFLQRHCDVLYQIRPLDCINIALECCHDNWNDLNNGIQMGVTCDLFTTFSHAGYNWDHLDFDRLAYHNPVGFRQYMSELLGMDGDGMYNEPPDLDNGDADNNGADNNGADNDIDPDDEVY